MNLPKNGSLVVGLVLQYFSRSDFLMTPIIILWAMNIFKSDGVMSLQVFNLEYFLYDGFVGSVIQLPIFELCMKYSEYEGRTIKIFRIT